MASVLVIDNGLKESVKEYGQIVDSVHQNGDFSAALEPFLGETGVTQKPELAAVIAQATSAATLAKLSDREFEPAYYLYVYLTSKLQGVTVEELVQDGAVLELLLELNPQQQPAVRDRRLLRLTTILSALNTLFNFLPAALSARVRLLGLILDVVEKLDLNFGLVQLALGNHLAAWAREAGALDAATRELFWRFVHLDKKRSLATLQLAKAFTAEYLVDLAELRGLVLFAFALPVVDVSFLVNNNVAAAMAQHELDELVAAFVKYTRGELLAAEPSGLTGVVAKSRIMAFARFLVDQQHPLISYASVPAALYTSTADLERLIVDAIKAGVVEGKMNQVQQTFYVVRVNRFVVAGNNAQLAKDWEAVRLTLLQWRAALENINEVVLDAKEKIVNSSV